jgi:hypothetical protein
MSLLDYLVQVRSISWSTPTEVPLYHTILQVRPVTQFSHTDASETAIDTLLLYLSRFSFFFQFFFPSLFSLPCRQDNNTEREREEGLTVRSVELIEELHTGKFSSVARFRLVRFDSLLQFLTRLSLRSTIASLGSPSPLSSPFDLRLNRRCYGAHQSIATMAPRRCHLAWTGARHRKNGWANLYESQSAYFIYFSKRS